MQTTLSSPSRTAADVIVMASSDRPGGLRDVMQTYADRLVEAGAFDRLTLAEAQVVGAVIAWDVMHCDDGADRLRERSSALLSGQWRWTDNPGAASYAFTAAAFVLDAL